MWSERSGRCGRCERCERGGASHLLGGDAVDQFVLHPVVVDVELPRRVDVVTDLRRAEQDHVVRVGVPLVEGGGAGGEEACGPWAIRCWLRSGTRPKCALETPSSPTLQCWSRVDETSPSTVSLDDLRAHAAQRLAEKISPLPCGRRAWTRSAYRWVQMKLKSSISSSPEEHSTAS